MFKVAAIMVIEPVFIISCRIFLLMPLVASYSIGRTRHFEMYACEVD